MASLFVKYNTPMLCRVCVFDKARMLSFVIFNDRLYEMEYLFSRNKRLTDRDRDAQINAVL